MNRPSPTEGPGHSVGRGQRTVGQVLGAGLFGAVMGASAGAALAGGIDGIESVVGATVGAVVLGVGEAVTDAQREPGHPKPLWWRIITSGALAAIVAWLLALVLPSANAVVVGGFFGLAAGSVGARLRKAGLGLAVGVLVGFIFEIWFPDIGETVVAAAAVVAYRLAASVAFRGRSQVRLMAERVPTDEIAYVVPFAAHTSYVGVDYLADYAAESGAEFARNPTDIGIVESMDGLAGPEFDPSLMHPLIREFYEHTSRFHLSIVPEWRPWMKLPYLAYRSLVARPLGQANAPFDIDEVQEGVVSWIDVIDVDHSGTIDYRAWVRAYEKTREPLYVGIYTVLRHHDVGYVSVGFPLPDANFTATLLPSNHRVDGLLLRSRANQPFPGHYLSALEPKTNDLTVLKLVSFDEEIDVYVEDGSLRTDHRFYLGGIRFLTLFYDIERADGGSPH